MRGRLRWALAGVAVATVALSGCSVTRQAPQSGPTPPSGTSSTTPGQSASSSLSAVPSQTTTAPQAVNLTLGEAMTRDWRPKQGVDGRIRLSVTSIEQADWSYFHGWQVPKKTQRSMRPYFVHATVVNAGTTDLGGFGVPLYILDDRNQLVEASTFGSATGNASFTPCQPGTLPHRFRHGDRLHSCLVMLVPTGSAVIGASFRPEESAQPVTWRARPKRLQPQAHRS